MCPDFGKETFMLGSMMKGNFIAHPVPNPFNPSTTITFGLEKPETIFMSIYDISGKLVKTYYHGAKINAGMYSEIWNGRNNQGKSVGSGIYFLKIKTDSFSETEKLILVR